MSSGLQRTVRGVTSCGLSGFTSPGKQCGSVSRRHGALTETPTALKERQGSASRATGPGVGSYEWCCPWWEEPLFLAVRPRRGAD